MDNVILRTPSDVKEKVIHLRRNFHANARHDGGHKKRGGVG